MEQKHKSRIKISGNKAEFLEPVTFYMGDKIQGAIDKIKEGEVKEADVTFTFSELQYIRRLLILDDVGVQLCRENIVESMDYRRDKK